MLYLAPVLFLLISFVFSMLGMGGSQLYIPILWWLGMDFKTEAIPLGMLLNVVSSTSSSITYIREKLIEWRTALTFGIFMIIFAPVGTWVNISLPTRPIILTFAIFTAAAAILMLSGWKPKGGELSPPKKLWIGIIGGSGLGFLAGLIGRGGGSFIVPLLYIMGLAPKVAAATSSLIVTFSGTSSFISHILTAAHPNWLIWGLCVGAVILGSQLGSRFMAKKLNAKAIKKVFGFVLLGIAILIIVKEYL
jgi:uncharacterized membrane protein YfcA